MGFFLRRHNPTCFFVELPGALSMVSRAASPSRLRGNVLNVYSWRLNQNILVCIRRLCRLLQIVSILGACPECQQIVPLLCIGPACKTGACKLKLTTAAQFVALVAIWLRATLQSTGQKDGQKRGLRHARMAALGLNNDQTTEDCGSPEPQDNSCGLAVPQIQQRGQLEELLFSEINMRMSSGGLGAGGGCHTRWGCCESRARITHICM